jgi:methionyl-tRNA formyltransferase
MLRISFFGTEISVLDTLRRSRFEVAGVYLPPPLPLWMIRHKISSAVYRLWSSRTNFYRLKAYRIIDTYTRKHGLPTIQDDRAQSKKVRMALTEKQINLGVVANFDQILPQSLISLPKHGFINLHPSLLPKYRGPTPLEYILLNQEPASGVTWHAIAPEIDAGAIMVQQSFDIKPEYNIQDLMRISLQHANQLLIPLLEGISAGRATATPQDESQASCYPKAGPDVIESLSVMGKL